MTTTISVRHLSLSLLAGTAVIALGHQAIAQQTVDTAQTTPVVSDGQDINITEDGSITVTEGTALTINSDNNATVDGDITVEDTSEDGSSAADNAGGVLITGDVTFDYTQSGDITIEDMSVVDPDGDETNGISPPDYAENRFGFRLDTGDYVGNIEFSNSAFLSVSGDNSVGIALDGNLAASAGAARALTVDGDVSVRGENTDALRINGNVTGNIELSNVSSFNVLGKDSNAVVVNGDVDGAFRFNGIVSVTGYQSPTPETEIQDDLSTTDVDESQSEEALAILERNNQQIALTSGDGITIGGDVTGGVLIDGPLPVEFAGVFTTDIDPDEDVSEFLTQNTSSSISVFGSGNALRIDGGTGGATIGLVDTIGIDLARDIANSDDNSSDDSIDDIPEYGDFGLINRGSLIATGVYNGAPTEVVSIRNVTIEGGFRNDGSIDTIASRSSATALTIGEGANIPLVLNSGRIGAVVSGSGGDATGVNILNGANVASFENNNRIEAFALSDDSDAVGLRDASGVLTELTNTGIISAILRDENDNDDNTGRDAADPVGSAIAIDLSANSSGVTITNTVFEDSIGDTSNRQLFGNILGDVLTGSGNDIYFADAGTTSGNLSLGTGNDVVDLSMGAIIVGDIDFGAGNEQLMADDATITGAVDFGSGNSSLSLNNGATLTGDISTTGSLDIDLLGSTLIFGSGTDLTVGSLNASATTGDTPLSSSLGFSVSEDGMSVASVTAGTAMLDADTGLDVVFEGAFAQDSVSQIILSAGALDVDIDALNASLDVAGNENIPILFTQSVSLENGGNDLRLTLARKSAAQLGIGSGLSNALVPVITALTADQALGSALFNASTTEEFTELFNQVVAGPLDAPLAYTRAQNNSVTSLVSHRVDAITSPDEKLQRRFWLQEEGYFVNRDSDAGSNGFDGGGFVIAGGVDAPVGPIDALGVSVHYASARYDEQLGEDFPFDRTTIGVDLYYAERLGKLEVDGRFGYAITDSTSERNIDFGDTSRLIQGSWDGTQFTANSRVRYRHNVGETQILPFFGFDFVALKEDAYTETGNAALILDVEEREAESLRANIGIELSRAFKTRERAYDFSVPGTFRPRLTAAWSQELLTDDYAATYQFAGGTLEDETVIDPGQKFTLLSEPESGAAILGGDVTYENEYATVHVGASGTFGEQAEIYTLRVGVGLKW